VEQNPKVTVQVIGATGTGKTSIAWLISETLRLHGFHTVIHQPEADFPDDSAREEYVRKNFLHSTIRTTEVTIETIQSNRSLNEP
jgi:uridine kinase